MKNKFINTEKTRRGKPAAAFLLSLFWTGAGEVRYGRKSAGITMMLLRALPFLLFPVVLTADPHTSLLYPFIGALFTAAGITLYSPFRILFLISSKEEIAERKMASLPFLLLYMTINSLITVTAVIVTLSFFSLHRIGSDELSPAFRKGDLLLTASISSPTTPAPGCIILHDTGNGQIPLRVISVKPAIAGLHRGRFSIMGRELELEAPSEETALLYPGSPVDQLLIEINGNRKYPVLIETKNSEKKTKGESKSSPRKIKIKKGEILLSLDDRRKGDFFQVTKPKPALPRIMGVILPSSIKRLPSLPWLKNN